MDERRFDVGESDPFLEIFSRKLLNDKILNYETIKINYSDHWEVY
jgi:hypothetical protein